MSDPIVSADEEPPRKDIVELVRKTVQDTLNALAEEMVGAERYERTAGRYKRKLVTTSGQIELDVPKLRGATFQTAVIERCRRRETSVGEAIIEMRLAGASTGRIEDVDEIPWGAGVSAGTVSNLDEKAHRSVEEWRSGPLAGEYPHVFTDGVCLKRSWGGSYENAGVLVATGVDGDGRREVIGCAGGLAESKDSWREFPLWLRGRGPRGVRMATGDRCRGMVARSRRCSPGQVPEVHGALLPQRLFQGAQAEAHAGRQDAEGHTRPGVGGGRRRQGGRSGRRPRCRAARGRGEGRARGLP